MSDEQDGAELTPGLTPEQEAAVRRLVADARHDEPIPATVAARLDRVLAHLATKTGTAAENPVVVDLDTRRRRRTAGRLVMAAAAVVVAGVAVGQVLGTGGLGQGSGDDGSADAPAAAEQQAGGGRDKDSALSPSDGTASSGEAEEFGPEPATGDVGAGDSSQDLLGEVPVNLYAESLDTDVRRVYRRAGLALAATSANRSYVAAAKPFSCPDAAYGDGLLLPAYFDGQPTVLAFRPPVGSQRLALLLECGTASTLASVSLRYDPAD